MFTLCSSHHAIAVDKLSDWMICLSGALLETMVPFPFQVAIMGQNAAYIYTISLQHVVLVDEAGRMSED